LPYECPKNGRRGFWIWSRACGRELSLKVDSGNRCAASILGEFSALRCCEFILAALTDSQMAGQTSKKLHVALAY